MPLVPQSFGFTITNAFEGLTFSAPVAIDAPPGETNRLFVVEKTGRIMVITNLARPDLTVFMDLRDRVYYVDEGGIIGLAFHPGFATNRYFFVNYTLKTNTEAGTGIHDRLARFEASSSNPNQASNETELPLITQFRRASEHHGGDIHFGPDGYLYMSLGDESGSDDTFNNGQVIDKNFFSGILRIDVDKRPGNLPPNPHPAVSTNYAIPVDNPFVGVTNFNNRAVDPKKIHTEFWAVGLRNPWRMSFDPITGRLFCGDVGQAIYEEINIIVRGGNYGWPYREGTIAGPRSGGGGISFADPLVEYMHGSSDALQASAVMGGVVYHGQRFPEIRDNYLFADHVNGNIWALRLDGANVLGRSRLTADPGISAFGIDPSNGDVLMAKFYGKNIDRLVYGTNSIGTPLPPTLADTGAFADLKTLTPNPGIVPYDVNVPLWSDGAIKRRWFSIPNLNQTIRAGPDGNWQFPNGTVWIKHFDLELTNGVPESARRLETRLLVRNGSGVYGATYRWNSTTNATLVPEEGADESFAVWNEGAVRTQVWHYPSRTECIICHNSVAGWTLGFKATQINRDFDFGNGDIENQMSRLSKAGYFSGDLTASFSRQALASLTNSLISREYRIRSYLDANCAQCHQPDGLGQSVFDTRIETPTSLAGMIDAVPINASGDLDNRIAAPGSVEHSLLFTRMATLGTERMPPLASSEIDSQALDLMRQWILTDLPHFQSFSAWQSEHFGSGEPQGSKSEDDPDGDGLSNYFEYLAGTDPLENKQFWQITADPRNQKVHIVFDYPANRAVQVQVTTNLLDSATWKPPETFTNGISFPATSFKAIIEDSRANVPQKFYRLQIAEP